VLIEDGRFTPNPSPLYLSFSLSPSMISWTDRSRDTFPWKRWRAIGLGGLGRPQLPSDLLTSRAGARRNDCMTSRCRYVAPGKWTVTACTHDSMLSGLAFMLCSRASGDHGRYMHKSWGYSDQKAGSHLGKSIKI